MRFLATASILIILLLITGEWEIKSSMKLTRRKVFAQETSANQGCRPIARIREIQGDVTIRSQRESENRRAYPGMELCEDSRVDAKQGMLIIDCYGTENKNIPVEGKLFFTKDCLPRNNPDYISPKADRIQRDQFITASTDGFASQPQRPQAVNPGVTPNPVIAQGRPLNPVVPTPVPQGQLPDPPLSRQGGVIGIGRGDQGPGVRDLQNRLRELGYFNSESTGFFGPITRSAVINFQRAFGIPATGLVSEETLIFLNNRVAVLPGNLIVPTPENPIPTLPNSRILRRGDNHPRVGVLQQRLSWLGYYDGRITEKFDERTEQAVISFQRANGIQPTGKVGATTEAYIERGLGSL